MGFARFPRFGIDMLMLCTQYDDSHRCSKITKERISEVLHLLGPWGRPSWLLPFIVVRVQFPSFTEGLRIATVRIPPPWAIELAASEVKRRWPHCVTAET